MERWIILRQLGGTIGDLFAGLESYDKTGKGFGKGFKPNTSALLI
jgi:hypothetical protein